METRVKLLGHPIHPMLAVLPLDLLSVGVGDGTDSNASSSLAGESSTPTVGRGDAAGTALTALGAAH